MESVILGTLILVIHILDHWEELKDQDFRVFIETQFSNYNKGLGGD